MLVIVCGFAVRYAIGVAPQWHAPLGWTVVYVATQVALVLAAILLDATSKGGEDDERISGVGLAAVAVSAASALALTVAG